MKLLCVIIPAYNEQESVDRVLRDINKQINDLSSLNYSLEILLVLNACTDRTEEIAEATALAHNIPLRIIHEPKQGYGYAHRRGIAEARGHTLLTLDCDNTYPPEAIIDMVAIIEDGVGFVTTNRLGLDPAMNGTSKLGNFLLTKATKILTGQTLKDSQSGMWAFKREHIADLLEGLGSGMELSEQLKIRLARAAIWEEIDIEYYERSGDSKLNPVSDGFRCLWRLVTT